MLVELLHRGVDRSKFSKALPYGVNDLMTGDAEDHSPGSCREGLVTLSAWLQNAAGVLNAVGRGYGVANASIICSPETLDLSFMKGSEFEACRIRVLSRKRPNSGAIVLSRGNRRAQEASKP